MNVLVNGLGNIGQTLCMLLSKYKKLLGISTVYGLKNTQIEKWNEVEIAFLQDNGITICTNKIDQYENLENILPSVEYIFDCNANKIGNQNKGWYEKLGHIKGFSAQGSEKGFGLPFMTGLNNNVISKQKFAQIVSCNTHAIGAILKVFSGGNIKNVVQGDFVIVRRSEDIGNHKRLVSANVVSRHRDEISGTHHAEDITDLLNTVNINIKIQSSDITTPSQLMHTVRFNLKLSDKIGKEEILKNICVSPLLSQTDKYDSNIVFELGRRYSYLGRIYSHAIINTNNLLFDSNDNRVKGWAFIPQEGNTLLSTIHALLIQVEQSNHEQILSEIGKDLILSNW